METDPSQLALLEAQTSSRRAKQRAADVASVAVSLRALREENHFAARIEEIFRGGTPNGPLPPE